MHSTDWIENEREREKKQQTRRTKNICEWMNEQTHEHRTFHSHPEMRANHVCVRVCICVCMRVFMYAMRARHTKIMDLDMGVCSCFLGNLFPLNFFFSDLSKNNNFQIFSTRVAPAWFGHLNQKKFCFHYFKINENNTLIVEHFVLFFSFVTFICRAVSSVSLLVFFFDIQMIFNVTKCQRIGFSIAI